MSRDLAARWRAAARIVVLGSLLILGAAARAGSNLVGPPGDLSDAVHYATIERGDRVQELLTSREAIDAAKKGEPLPSGTVIILAEYGTRYDAQGDLERDAEKRLVKAYLQRYLVMEKRTGWGADYPPEKRNGEWEFEVFDIFYRPMRRAHTFESCFTCHREQASRDFVFTLDWMKTAK